MILYDTNLSKSQPIPTTKKSKKKKTIKPDVYMFSLSSKERERERCADIE